MGKYQKLSIKNWAVEDRPRERLLAKGIQSLTNTELIALLIGSGTKEISAVELANGLDVTYESVDEILSGLRRSNIVATVDEGRDRFLPVRDPERVTLKEIVEAMEGEHLVTASWPQDRQKEVIEEIFESARGALGEVLGHITIKDVSERLGAKDDDSDTGTS